MPSPQMSLSNTLASRSKGLAPLPPWVASVEVLPRRASVVVAGRPVAPLDPRAGLGGLSVDSLVCPALSSSSAALRLPGRRSNTLTRHCSFLLTVPPSI